MSKTKLPPGTWIQRDLFQSKAFISLTGFAPQLLILFLAKRKFDRSGREGKKTYDCINGDELTFTYIEAQVKYGVSRKRFTRALDELLAKGFITINHVGGAYQRDKTVYSLSVQWAFWKPGKVYEKRGEETIKRGFCKPKPRKKAARLSVVKKP